MAKPLSTDILRHFGISAHRIHKHLWQGAKPPMGDLLYKLGFRTLVLCAQEFQPPTSAFVGLNVIRAPMIDDVNNPLTKEQWDVARYAARLAYGQWLSGERTLIACHAGLNRSGLVTALTMRQIADVPMTDIVEHIRDSRPGALFNRPFVEALVRGGPIPSGVFIRKRRQPETQS